MIPNRHYNKFIYLLIYTVYFLTPSLALSQVDKKWVAVPFEQKVFIENHGQFNEKTPNKSDMALFGSQYEGIELYFNASGITYRHDEFVAMTEEEKEKSTTAQLDRQSDKYHEEKGLMKAIPCYFSITWVGANPNPQIIAEEAVSWYYTYGTRKMATDETIKANAYKKIIYKNLYPNIDVEYTFPADSSGIKYSIILHPGANPEEIKMRYDNAENISIDIDGNLKIKSCFGEFIDHSPKSFYSDTFQTIPSAFTIDKNIISFSLAYHNAVGINTKNRSIIIDPWVTNPAFSGYNAAYDVDYDLQGNVYAYGGSNALQLMKFDNTGIIQWVYTTPFIVFQPYTNSGYGDFAVDPSSGSSYIAEGADLITGANIHKVNSSGVLVSLFAGNQNLGEMWRIVYDKCSGQLIIAGGGINTGTANACIIDTSLISMVPVNVLSTTAPYHDISLLTVDNENNCFMATAKSSADLNFDNVLLKCPANSLLPLSYLVADNHTFYEVMSVQYVNNSTGHTNAMNGMAVSNKYLYTYDGYLIQRWNKNTGVLINSAVVMPPGPVISWGGISVDDCDNIFVGVNASVIQYDTNFTIISTLSAANTVYDVRLAPGNILYVCGKQFVSSIQLSITCDNALNLSMSSGDLCLTQGTASVTVTGGNAPYTYQWSPSGGTNATATGLSPGTTYTVTVTDNSCIFNTQTATVECPINSIDPCNTDLLSTFMPNAFSPNSDGLNDRLCIPANACITGFVLKVYDRWGEKVFESTSLTDCWDGTYKGQDLNTAVFVYYLEAILSTGDKLEHKGNISLIK